MALTQVTLALLSATLVRTAPSAFVAPDPAVAAATAVQGGINVGSTGADGQFSPPNNQSIQINLANGEIRSLNSGTVIGTAGHFDASRWAVVFNFTSVSIPPSTSVTFLNHPTHAPVVWLANGNVTINGGIYLYGSNNNTNSYAEPGPGGFRGGLKNNNLNIQTAAFGPGGALYSATNAGVGGSFATQGTTDFGTLTPGPTYGGATIFPLIGGSGGSAYGPAGGTGGGGGGGAILIACDGSIVVNGTINANGGVGNNSGGGSGGAIRLLANSITLAATSSVTADGGGHNNAGGVGGSGRVRIEGNGAQNISILHQTSPFADVSSVPGTPFPIVEPKIKVASITANGQTFDASTLDPVADLNAGLADLQVSAPAGPATLSIVATNVPVDALGNGPVVKVRVTYSRGNATIYTTAPLNGTSLMSTTTQQVDLQAGVSAIQLSCRLQ